MIVRGRLVCVGLVVLVAVLPVLLAGCHSGSGEEPVGLFESGSASCVVTEQAQLRGDMDGDGNPSVSDAIAILRIVVGFDADVARADADGDGSTTVADAILVLRCVVGLSEWPLGNLCGTNIIDLTAALAAPMATNPHPASTPNQEALNAYLSDDDNIPDTTAELTADLDEEDLKPIATNYAYYIRLGRAGSEDLLARALNKYGDKEMAVDYLNCGNGTLEQAAHTWADKHGYEVYTTPGVATGPQWGEGE